jgi:hypothetical protein
MRFPNLARNRHGVRLRGHGSQENTEDFRLSPGYSQGAKKGVQIFHMKSQANNLSLREILFHAVILHSN